MTFWRAVCILFLLVDITASAVMTAKRAKWSRRTVALAVGGFGGEIIVLLYVLGIVR